MCFQLSLLFLDFSIYFNRFFFTTPASLKTEFASARFSGPCDVGQLRMVLGMRCYSKRTTPNSRPGLRRSNTTSGQARARSMFLPRSCLRLPSPNPQEVNCGVHSAPSRWHLNVQGVRNSISKHRNSLATLLLTTTTGQQFASNNECYGHALLAFKHMERPAFAVHRISRCEDGIA